MLSDEAVSWLEYARGRRVFHVVPGKYTDELIASGYIEGVNGVCITVEGQLAYPYMITDVGARALAEMEDSKTGQ